MEWKYSPYLLGLFLIVIISGATVFFTQGSLVGDNHRGIALKNCNIDSNYNINDRCNLDYNNPDFHNMGGNGWDVYVHKDGNTQFSVEVDYLRHLGEDFSPPLPYLANNGYLNEDGQEDVQEDGDIGNVRMDDIKWNSEVKRSLQSGTQCSVRIQPYSISEVVYTWNESGEVKTQKYHEDWGDEYRDFDYFFPDKVTLQAEKVIVNEHSTYCVFDFKEMVDKGAEHSNMVEFKAGRLEAGGDDYNEGYAKINVNWGMDDDLDGIRNENDKCESEPGIEELQGCPNSEPEVSLNLPENATVNSQISVSVNASDADGHDLEYSWNNGDSGESTTYVVQNESRTVQVSVSDGFTSVNASETVEVVQAEDDSGEKDESDGTGQGNDDGEGDEVQEVGLFEGIVLWFSNLLGI